LAREKTNEKLSLNWKTISSLCAATISEFYAPQRANFLIIPAVRKWLKTDGA